MLILVATQPPSTLYLYLSNKAGFSTNYISSNVQNRILNKSCATDHIERIPQKNATSTLAPSFFQILLMPQTKI